MQVNQKNISYTDNNQTQRDVRTNVDSINLPNTSHSLSSFTNQFSSDNQDLKSSFEQSSSSSNQSSKSAGVNNLDDYSSELDLFQEFNENSSQKLDDEAYRRCASNVIDKNRLI